MTPCGHQALEEFDNGLHGSWGIWATCSDRAFLFWILLLQKLCTAGQASRPAPSLLSSLFVVVVAVVGVVERQRVTMLRRIKGKAIYSNSEFKGHKVDRGNINTSSLNRVMWPRIFVSTESFFYIWFCFVLEVLVWVTLMRVARRCALTLINIIYPCPRLRYTRLPYFPRRCRTLNLVACHDNYYYPSRHQNFF